MRAAGAGSTPVRWRPGRVIDDPISPRAHIGRRPEKSTALTFRRIRWRRAGTGAPQATGRPGPLSGLRVLDFSWALVGSFTTKTLGDLGAEVIKVETGRGRASRASTSRSATKAIISMDKPWFAHLNTSKKASRWT